MLASRLRRLLLFEIKTPFPDVESELEGNVTSKRRKTYHRIHMKALIIAYALQGKTDHIFKTGRQVAAGNFATGKVHARSWVEKTTVAELGSAKRSFKHPDKPV